MRFLSGLPSHQAVPTLLLTNASSHLSLPPRGVLDLLLQSRSAVSNLRKGSTSEWWGHRCGVCRGHSDA
ncbi:hypothetical protein TIFTF001_034182 [Ficus carica]|uniref:Uncharacterized protein n=1 Tax=Ficus carica TaxID=3494 RepID=A0AA88E0M6_FICCA|nr:hypothetical protein TIFTF001_034182 [Ficus carica]